MMKANETDDVVNEGADKVTEKKKKRTPSSYLLFSIEYRKEMAQNYPEKTLGDISKLCGEKWKSMEDAEKKPWIDKANELKSEIVTE